MLKQLRNKKTMKHLLWITIALIFLPFVFWGITSPLRSKNAGPLYAGKIFGKKISLEEYSASLRATKIQAMLMYGPKLNEIYDSLNLEKQAWDRLILLYDAKKKRIRADDEEVVSLIQSFPFLQSKGQFDKQSYDMLLNQVFGTTARDFEENIRGSLTISKLRDSVIKDAKITGKEVKEAYKKENEKSKIAYILVTTDSFKKDTSVDEAEIKKYYRSKSETFRVPEQVNIRYIGFEFSDYQKDINISEDEIKKYYDENKDEFDPKKEFKDARDIIKNKLIRRAAKEKALLAAEKIDYILSDKEKTLDAVAAENGLKVSESGFFSKQGFIPKIGWFPELQKTAFKLKAGERSDLIKSDAEFVNGHYIIETIEKKASYIPSIEEVRPNIEETLKVEKAAKLAEKQAQRLHRKLSDLIKNKQMKFGDAVEKIMRKVKYSEAFARTGYIQGLGSATEIGESAFTSGPGGISPALKTRAGYCIFSVLEIQPADEAQFKKKRKELTNKTLEAKKNKLLNDWYGDLTVRANLQSNIPEAEE